MIILVSEKKFLGYAVNKLAIWYWDVSNTFLHSLQLLQDLSTCVYSWVSCHLQYLHPTAVPFKTLPTQKAAVLAALLYNHTQILNTPFYSCSYTIPCQITKMQFDLQCSPPYFASAHLSLKIDFYMIHSEYDLPSSSFPRSSPTSLATWIHPISL